MFANVRMDIMMTMGVFHVITVALLAAIAHSSIVLLVLQLTRELLVFQLDSVLVKQGMSRLEGLSVKVVILLA